MQQIKISNIVLLAQVITIFCQFSDENSLPGLFRGERKPFAIDGSWSSWGEWSDCFDNTPDKEYFYSNLEDFSIQVRERECNAPKPLYGGEDCPPPKYRYKQCLCDNPLGLSTGRIKDNQISAYEFVEGHSPSESRIGTNFTGWCAKRKLDYFQRTYIQIDFDHFVKLKKIVTIGTKEGRVSRFSLKSSVDGDNWESVFTFNDAKEKVFTGNIMPQMLRVNDFSSLSLAKYLRLYPIEGFGMPCLKMEVYGCIFTCGEYISSSFGMFSAYSSPYYESNCLWKIEVLNTTALTFDLASFFVPCTKGHLDFRIGDNFENSKLLERKCLENDDSEFELLKLNHNSIWINFVSNSSSLEDGFSINYFSECRQTVNLVPGIPATLTTPNFPNDYFNNLDCTWNIISPDSSKEMIFKVNYFAIESMNIECENDYVKITSDDNIKSEMLNKKHCSSNPLKEAFSIEAEKLIIQFKSDDMATEKGFSIEIVSGKISPNHKQQPTIASNIRKYINTTNPSMVESTLKNNASNGFIKKKVKKHKDDTWTIIIVSAFSAFCVILLLAIVGANLKRFLENRNDVNAQCAKALEQQKQKKKAKQYELTKQKLEEIKRYQNLQSKSNDNEKLLTSTSKRNNDEVLNLLSEKEGNEETNDIEVTYKSPSTDSFAVEKLGLTDSPDAIESNYIDEQPDDVDKDCVDANSYDSSTPQIHSPLRSDLYLHDNESNSTCV